MFNMRFRHLYMVLFTILVIAGSFLADPDNGLIQNLPLGAGIVAQIMLGLRAIVYIALLHISRRALFDYIDLEVYFDEARKGNAAAGQAIIGVSIAMVAIALLIVAAVA